MKSSPTTYVAWHTSQVKAARVHASEGGSVLALDFWVEQELRSAGIDCISITKEPNAAEWWLLAQVVAHEWYRLRSMDYFMHDEMRLGEVFEPMVEAYLSKLFYYVNLFQGFAVFHKNAKLHIDPPQVIDAPTVGPLAFFERSAIADAARMVGFTLAKPAERTRSKKHIFSRTPWKSWVVRIYTAAASLFPRRRYTLYASEYWSHISALMQHLGDFELVLMEASELQHMSWRNIFRHRIRIRHPQDVMDKRRVRAATAQAQEFLHGWASARLEISRYLSAQKGMNWEPVLEAFEYLHAYSARVMFDADALKDIMKRERPDIILQRASIGGRQHHYFLMARLAAQLRIPSIEIQHASAYVDPRSVHSHLETSMLAAYGTYTALQYEKIGYAPERIIPIGSPRFDRASLSRMKAERAGRSLFKKIGFDSRPVLVAAVPFSDALLSPFILDSHELSQFFQALKAVKNSLPQLQILFKFRNPPSAQVRAYLEGLFSRDAAIAVKEDLFSLLCASDMALSGNSTVLYEALLAQKPLFLYPWKPWDSYMKEIYSPAGAMPEHEDGLAAAVLRAYSDESYRNELLARGAKFLQGYAFDGHSSERLAELLRAMAK